MRELPRVYPHAPVVPTEPVALTRTFRSPRTFSLPHSLLGRWIRHVTGDRLRGEALFVLTLTTLVMGVLIAHYLGWALLQPVMTGPDTTSWQIGFWLAQIGSVAFLLLIGGIGWRPEVTATVDTEAGLLSVEQGNASLTVDVDDIQDVSVVSARQYHLHYRRYAATKPFIGELGEEVVIVRTPNGPLAISIDDAEAGALVDLVTEREELLVESAPAS